MAYHSRDKRCSSPRTSDVSSWKVEGLHAAHQGVSSMLANARERFFWPGLDAAVKLYRAQCRQCNEQAPSQPAEPPIESQAPEVPFQMVATDLCKLSGFSYLIYVDAYSGWVEVASLTSTNFQAITKVLLMYFALFGVPEEIAADGGPPFDSHDYTTFLKRWRIRRRLSSAYYPQSNGRAEAGVKTAKRILLGNVDPRTGKLDNEAAVRALMAHRNTPCQLTGVSPAIALFGRPIRDHLPMSNWLRYRNFTKQTVPCRRRWKPPSHLEKQKIPQTDLPSLPAEPRRQLNPSSNETTTTASRRRSTTRSSTPTIVNYTSRTLNPKPNSCQTRDQPAVSQRTATT